MMFDLDVPRDCDRLASLVSSLQAQAVDFYLTRDEHQGGFGHYVTLYFGKQP